DALVERGEMVVVGLDFLFKRLEQLLGLCGAMALAAVLEDAARWNLHLLDETREALLVLAALAIGRQADAQIGAENRLVLAEQLGRLLVAPGDALGQGVDGP